MLMVRILVLASLSQDKLIQIQRLSCRTLLLGQGAVIELEQLGQDPEEFVRELFLLGRLLQAFGQLQEFEEGQCARQAR